MVWNVRGRHPRTDEGANDFALRKAGRPREHRGCMSRETTSSLFSIALPSCTDRPAQEKKGSIDHTCPFPFILLSRMRFLLSGSSEFVELVFSIGNKLNRIIFSSKTSKLHQNFCIKPHIRRQESGSAACNRIKFACTEHSYHVFHWARDDAIKIKLTLASVNLAILSVMSLRPFRYVCLGSSQGHAGNLRFPARSQHLQVKSLAIQTLVVWLSPFHVCVFIFFWGRNSLYFKRNIFGTAYVSEDINHNMTQLWLADDKTLTSSSFKAFCAGISATDASKST